jgi:hypothetical protein
MSDDDRCEYRGETGRPALCSNLRGFGTLKSAPHPPPTKLAGVEDQPRMAATARKLNGQLETELGLHPNDWRIWQ